MKRYAKSRRRWFGAVCLLGAIALLLAGQTGLEGRLAGVAFILYWLLCLLLTLLAMVTALLDVAALRRENRDRQRALIESTIEEIQAGRTRPAERDSHPTS